MYSNIQTKELAMKKKFIKAKTAGGFLWQRTEDFSGQR